MLKRTSICNSEKLLLVRTLLIALVVFTSLFADCQTQAAAAQPSVDFSQALRWRLIGPFRGGRVTAVAGVPADPSTYYFGTPGGGIWKTTDGGRLWKPIFDSVPVASIGAIAVSPADPNVIFAGTGEQTAGDGVYKSTDAGRSWTSIGLKDVLFIHSILLDPRNPELILVAAAGERQSATGGIYKSSDGGKSWNKTLPLDDRNAGIYDMEQASDAPEIIYAARLQQSVRGGPPANPQQRAAQDGEILVSSDEGSTWSKAGEEGLPQEARGRIGVAVAPGSHGKTVYAIMSQGLFRSDDGGAHWNRETNDPRILGNGYFSRIFIDPNNADVIYVAQTSMYRSKDGGKTFESWMGAPSGDDVHVLWINPRNSKHMILGVDQGGIVSVDGGDSWTSWYNQPTGQFYHVTTDRRFPYTVYAAQQDSGTAAVHSRSDFGEITTRDWAPIGGFEFSFIAPDPLNANIIYTGGWYGSVLRFDRVTGQVLPVFVRSEKYRTAGMAPAAFSPQDPHLLIVGSQFVMTSRDGGATWRQASPDLTQKAGSKSNAEPADTRNQNAVISTLSLSRVHAGEIWAGTANGIVQLTVDGRTWKDVTPPSLPAHASIRVIESSAHDAATAYVVVNARDERGPIMLRTRDYGKNWQSIAAGLRANRRVNVVREDPVRKQMLFAGTDDGIYYSLDDGDRWQSLQLDLPTTPVSDLEVHGDDLVASTYGRSLWILDDIDPLRWPSDFAGSSAPVLLEPEHAIRARWDMNQDTPLPVETPAGKNPPDGALVDFFLPDTAQSVKLEIYDAAGKLVRSIGTQPEPFDTAPANAPEYWFEQAKALSNHAGLNRYVWDLRYPAPKTLRYSYFNNPTEYIEYTLADHAIPGETPRQQPMGVLVLPGKYTLALTVDGKSYRRALQVEADPRVHVPAADLTEQLRVERIASGAMDASYQAFQQSKKLLDAINGETGKTEGKESDKTTPPALSALQKKVEEVANHDHTDLGFGPANRELARLFEMISSGDGRPAAPLAEGIGQICRDVSKRLEEWKTINGNDVPQWNLSSTTKLPTVETVPSAPDCQ